MAANVNAQPGSTPAVPDDLVIDSDGRAVMLVREPRGSGQPQDYRVYRENDASTGVTAVGSPLEHGFSGRLTVDGCGWLVVAYASGDMGSRTIQILRWEE